MITAVLVIMVPSATPLRIRTKNVIAAVFPCGIEPLQVMLPLDKQLKVPPSGGDMLTLGPETSSVPAGIVSTSVTFVPGLGNPTGTAMKT